MNAFKKLISKRVAGSFFFLFSFIFTSYLVDDSIIDLVESAHADIPASACDACGSTDSSSSSDAGCSDASDACD
jgi:hypothetical protein